MFLFTVYPTISDELVLFIKLDHVTGTRYSVFHIMFLKELQHLMDIFSCFNPHKEMSELPALAIQHLAKYIMYLF